MASELILDWSPEQISGWLKRRYPSNENMRVSHETIYRTLELITASHANLIARLPQESQADAFERCWRKDWQDSEPHLLPAKHVAGWIQNNLYLALADAPFDREDPSLNSAAGACTIPAKQTKTATREAKAPTPIKPAAKKTAAKKQIAA